MKNYHIILVLYLNIILLCSCNSSNKLHNEQNIQIDTSHVIKIQKPIKKDLIYSNQIFNTNIKSAICNKKEIEQSIGIINLGSNDKLAISFDDLIGDRKNYYYTILHCNEDWTKSNLIESEFIEGFSNQPIINYAFSFNTIQQYTHYEFEFPNSQIKPTLSGNYVFKIYEENGDVILFKRFMVLDSKVTIKSNVRKATLAEYRAIKHEIDFSINHKDVDISDPFTEIKVHIKQNNNEENTVTNLSPLFVKNEDLIYDYEEENTFFGNNEFRHFDFSSLRYQSERIQKINFDGQYNNIYLFNDQKRSYDQYSIQPDINGKFLINSQEGWESKTEADYAYVHFSLPIDQIINDDIYLLGEFSDWILKDDFKLNYNIQKNQYEKKIFLKQGYYNYQYAVLNKDKKKIDISFIEGSHYQTRNEYHIYVYLRKVGSTYDQLVGYSRNTSNELF